MVTSEWTGLFLSIRRMQNRTGVRSLRSEVRKDGKEVMGKGFI